MAYVCVKLDETSKNTLMTTLQGFIPASWEPQGDHVTIHLGKPLESDAMGQRIEITATSIGYSEGAVSVKIKGIDVQSGNPHCTLAYNAKGGYKPMHAKEITSWIELQKEIPLYGEISFVADTIKLSESNTMQKDPSQIIRVSFYDFDFTLVDEPMPELGRNIWKHKTGKEFPHSGWWSKEESLDHNIFTFRPIIEVTTRLRSDFEDPSCWTVLLSNRMEKLIPNIQTIMDEFDLKIDEFSLKPKDNLPKPVRIKRTLPKFPQATQVDIHEDDIINLDSFQLMKDEIEPNGYVVSIFQIHPAGSKNRRVRLL